MVFFFVSKYVCVNTIFDFVRQYVVLSVLATIFQNCLFIILGDNSYREGPKCIEWNEWTVYFREKNNKRTELKCSSPNGHLLKRIRNGYRNIAFGGQWSTGGRTAHTLPRQLWC